MTFFNVMSLSLMILSWSYFLVGQIKKKKQGMLDGRITKWWRNKLN
jgi:hypothetical protein